MIADLFCWLFGHSVPRPESNGRTGIDFAGDCVGCGCFVRWSRPTRVRATVDWRSTEVRRRQRERVSCTDYPDVACVDRMECIVGGCIHARAKGIG